MYIYHPKRGKGKVAHEGLFICDAHHRILSSAKENHMAMPSFKGDREVLSYHVPRRRTRTSQWPHPDPNTVEFLICKVYKCILFLAHFFLVSPNSSYYIYYLLFRSSLYFSVSLIVLQTSSPMAPVPVPQLILKKTGHLSLLLLRRHGMTEGPLPRLEAFYCSVPPTNLDPFDYWHIVHPAWLCTILGTLTFGSVLLSERGWP